MAVEERIRMQLIQILSETSEVQKATLFGSRARGDEDERSDIDLALEAPGIDQRHWLELLTSLERIDTLLPIDIIRWEEASSELREKILEEGKVLYERS